MGFQPGLGRPMVSDEFNAMCTEAKVEARVQPMPNPGNPMQSMRLITFTNFNKTEDITIQEQDAKRKVHIVGPKNALTIMVSPNDPLPLVLKGLPNDNV